MSTRKDAFYVPENANLDGRREVLSPSGKYKLVITPFATRPGSWNYTQGLVYAVGSDTPLAEVRRNYSSFPNSWVEGHPKGNFLIGGEDYQGQTVVDLDTGKRRDELSEGADKGAGFCWVEHRYDAVSQILIVCGCHWACPYEFRFYDFSDPMNGWPEIESEGIYDDAKWPVIEADGTIRCFETSDDGDDDGDIPKVPPVERAITTYKREGLKLVVVNEWVSEAEKARRIARAEAERKYEVWKENFKATDPLYLAYVELVKDPSLSPEDYMSTGITYDGWGGDAWKGDESRWCRRIATKKKGGVTIDLEWAVLTGPIKLVIYKDGKHVENKFFGHSVEDMERAFAYAKAVLA